MGYVSLQAKSRRFLPNNVGVAYLARRSFMRRGSAAAPCLLGERTPPSGAGFGAPAVPFYFLNPNLIPPASIP
jgi:hypothetical protein